MRHKVAGYKLGRNTAHRRSLLRNLVTSVIIEERVETTVPKAKAARPLVEKMITLGKRGDLAARRLAAAYLMTNEAVVKLFDTVGPRFGDRNGGYLRIVRTGWNKGDGADKAFLELLGSERCWTKNARSAPRTAPKKSPKPGKPWKTPKRKLSTMAASSRSRTRKKTRKSSCVGHTGVGTGISPVQPSQARPRRRRLSRRAVMSHKHQERPRPPRRYMSSRGSRW
jgi:large subunit ribosomal protein L17